MGDIWFIYYSGGKGENLQKGTNGGPAASCPFVSFIRDLEFISTIPTLLLNTYKIPIKVVLTGKGSHSFATPLKNLK